MAAAMCEPAFERGDALIVVDVQNDFLPGGALAVPRGDEVIEPVNRLLRRLARLHLPIFATRDWHPPTHCSFREQGGPWPPHCIAGTHGAEFPVALKLPADAQVISKATRPEADTYSDFDGTDLAQRLHDAGCRRVFVAGVATEYCVRATVLDARAAGFEVVVLEDAVRALEVHVGDEARALGEMRAAGARIARSNELPDRKA